MMGLAYFMSTARWLSRRRIEGDLPACPGQCAPQPASELLVAETWAAVCLRRARSCGSEGRGSERMIRARFTASLVLE